MRVLEEAGGKVLVMKVDGISKFKGTIQHLEAECHFLTFFALLATTPLFLELSKLLFATPGKK